MLSSLFKLEMLELSTNSTNGVILLQNIFQEKVQLSSQIFRAKDILKRSTINKFLFVNSLLRT